MNKERIREKQIKREKIREKWIKRGENNREMNKAKRE